MKWHIAHLRIKIWFFFYVHRMMKPVGGAKIPCAQLVVVWWNWCKLCSSEKLLTNVFDHYAKQPWSWLDVSRMLRWPIETFVYPWRRLTTRSHDQLTFIGVWSQLVWNCSSKGSQQQVKYFCITMSCREIPDCFFFRENMISNTVLWSMPVITIKSC